MDNLLEKSRSNADEWLRSNIDSDSKNQIRLLLEKQDSKELIDSFYRGLEFGTGGLRGIMGVGPNCINRYTIGTATQGLSNYLIKAFPDQPIKVAIAHDSRNQSGFFAQVTADVFSANGIQVFLFPELRPTPLLSFAIRYLGCQSGVVITASHNPKEYNGYKAYWSDGAQLVPPHDQRVMEEVNAITSFDAVRFTPNPSKISRIGPEVENAYYEAVKKVIPRQDSIRKQNKISLVYSSLHGAGITMVPECLKRLGFTGLTIVEEQRIPDGNFPTVPSPNPEERSTMEMAVRKAQQINADLVMATDPDTDRVGIGIQDNDGEFFLLNGNQALSLMMWFILKNLKEAKNHYIAKTIVTSELIDTMATHYGVTCYNTLTGFKYIAELMRGLEGKEHFVAAGEESYGYMVGDFVRDKDAVSACAFYATLAAVARDDQQSLFKSLLTMYQEFGFYLEGLVNLVRKGAEGEQQILAMMKQFRNNPPESFGGEKIVRMLDYQSSLEKDLRNKSQKKIQLPQSDVLQFYTEAGSKISVRPSGTEPKIKFYISVKDTLASPADYTITRQRLQARIRTIEKELVG
jgi:phosphoglucomutase